MVEQMPVPSLDFRLRPDETPAESVRRVGGLLLELTEWTAQTLDSPSETEIHAVRTGLKRLGALLATLKPVLEADFYVRETARVKNAARLLAAARDRAVALTTLGNLQRPKVEPVDRAILLGVSRALETVTEATEAVAITGACEKIAASLRMSLAAAEWAQASAAGCRTVREGVELTFRKMERRRKKALKTGEMDAFHRWRVALKALYYQLQWLEPAWPRKLGKLTETLSKLENGLGKLHDLANLRDLLAWHRERFPIEEAVDLAIRHAEAAGARRQRAARKRAKKLAEKLRPAFWRKLWKRLEEFQPGG